MLWIFAKGRYEVSINLAQWMIGVNWTDGGWNLFGGIPPSEGRLR